MPKRLAWLLLAALAAVAWLLLRDADAPGASGAGGQGRRTEEPARGDGEDATQADATRREFLEPPPAAQEFDPEELRLPSFVGRVLDEAGRPLAGATVAARGMAALSSAAGPEGHARRPSVAWTAATRADGAFTLPEVPVDGLFFEFLIAHPAAAPLRLANQPAWSGRTRDLGDLRLARPASVLGRVRDADGRGLADAALEVVPEPGVEAAASALELRAPLPAIRARSRADGSFRLDGLPISAVRLRARTADGATLWSDAFTPAPGSTATVDLIGEPGRALAFRVLDPAEQPIPGASLTLRCTVPGLPPADRQAAEASADPHGAGRVFLPARATEAEWLVRAPGHAPLRRPLTPSDLREDPVVFRLAALPVVRGEVVDPDGRPVSGAQVGLAPPRAGDGPPTLQDARASAVTDAAGSFELRLDLRHPDEALVVQAWDDRHAPAAQAPCPSGPDAAATRLRLELRPGSSVAGRVLAPDGRPAAGARVALRRMHGPRWNRLTPLTDSPRGAVVWARATTDAAGAFRFDGLEAYDYFVEAVLPPHAPGLSEDFGLTASRTDLQILLPAACGIVGQIDGDLRALPPLVVVASARRMGWLLAEVDPEGRFAFPGLAPEEWNLSLRPAVLGGGFTSGLSGGAPLARLDGIRVDEGATVPVVLRADVTRFGRLDGRVTRAGRPAPRLDVWLIADRGEPDPEPEFAALQRLAQARRATTDAEGAFSAGALEAGSWWLVVCDPGAEPTGWREARGRLDPRGRARQRIVVEEGGASRCDLDLRSGTLRLRMRAETGFATLLLTPHPESTAGAPRVLRVGPEGLVLDDLPAGPWRLAPFHDANDARDVVISEQAEIAVEIAPDPVEATQ